MERVIPIRIRDKIAAAPRDALYVCGNSDYKIKFDFDDEWEGFNEKTARFVYNGQFVDMIFSGDVCPVPIISNTYAFEVGVYAGNLSTTTKAYVPATKSVLCGLNIPAEPVSVYVPSSELEKKADKDYVDGLPKGSNVYVQTEEPADAPDGSFWINPDEEESSAADTSGFSGSDFDIVLTRDSRKKELAVICTGLDPAESYALHLYTVSRRRGNAQKKWQHHPNYDIDDSKMNIQRKGYGRIAGTSYEYVRLDGDPIYYPPVPDWMPNKGYLQTEWPLIPDENGVGKVIINPRNWLVPLLKPDWPSDSLDAIERFYFIGAKRNDSQSLPFKFRVVRLSDGRMSRLSEQTFSAGNPLNAVVTLVDTDSADTVAIAKESLHTSISVR